MIAKQNRQVFSILLLSSFVSTLGLGIIVPVLPVYAETLGASGIWIGLIFSGFSIARFFVMPFVGKISDRSGRKNFIASGLFLYAAVSFIFIFAETPGVLTVLRFGQGFAAAMIIPIAQAYAGELAPANSEGKYMGIFSLALFAGFGVGPLVGGGLNDLYGMDCSIYALSGLTFFAGLLVCFFLTDIQDCRKSVSQPDKTIFGVLRNRVVRGLIVFRSTAAMCRGAIIAFVPIFAYYELQLSSSEIGIIISGNILVTAILQAPFGVLADKVERKKLVIIGGIIFSSLILIIPLVKTFSQLFVLSLFSGVSGALVLPAATAIMVQEGKAYGMGFSMSLFNMSMSFGLAVGPLLAGFLSEAFGLSFVFYLFSLIGLLGIGFFALNYHRS